MTVSSSEEENLDSGAHRESHMNTETETEPCLQAKHKGSQAVTRLWQRTQKDQPCPHLDLGLLTSRTEKG
jgi:hypothetical protein